MTCPQCHKHIPAKAVWTASGLSGANVSWLPREAFLPRRFRQLLCSRFHLDWLMRRSCFCGIGVRSFCWRLRDSSRCSRWCSRWQRP